MIIDHRAINSICGVVETVDTTTVDSNGMDYKSKELQTYDVRMVELGAHLLWGNHQAAKKKPQNPAQWQKQLLVLYWYIANKCVFYVVVVVHIYYSKKYCT